MLKILVVFLLASKAMTQMCSTYETITVDGNTVGCRRTFSFGSKINYTMNMKNINDDLIGSVSFTCGNQLESSDNCGYIGTFPSENKYYIEMYYLITNIDNIRHNYKNTDWSDPYDHYFAYIGKAPNVCQLGYFETFPNYDIADWDDGLIVKSSDNNEVAGGYSNNYMENSLFENDYWRIDFFRTGINFEGKLGIFGKIPTGDLYYHKYTNEIDRHHVVIPERHFGEIDNYSRIYNKYSIIQKLFSSFTLILSMIIIGLFI